MCVCLCAYVCVCVLRVNRSFVFHFFSFFLFLALRVMCEFFSFISSFFMSYMMVILNYEAGRGDSYSHYYHHHRELTISVNISDK